MAKYAPRLNSLEDLQAIKEAFLAETEKYRHTVIVCGGTGCVSAHCADVLSALKKQYSVRGLRDEVRIVHVNVSAVMMPGKSGYGAEHQNGPYQIPGGQTSDVQGIFIAIQHRSFAGHFF